jgi:hypothetical protein
MQCNTIDVQVDVHNGVEFDSITRDWAVWVNGDLQGYRNTRAEALELLDECTARYARQGLIEVQTASVELVPVHAPCPFADAIEAELEAWEIAA